MKRPELSDLLVGTVTAVLVLLVSLMVGKLLDLLDLRVFVIGVAIFVVVVAGIVGVVYLIARADHKYDVNALAAGHLAEVETLLKGLRLLVPPTGFTWLVTDGDLIDLESRASGRDVWVVSPDLSHDTVRADIQRAVRANLSRGMRYTYIVPRNERIAALLPALRTLFEAQLETLTVISIPEEVLRGIAIRHLAVYNPNVEGDETPQVYLELPIPGRGYWVRLSDEDALTMIGRLRRLIVDDVSSAAPPRRPSGSSRAV